MIETRRASRTVSALLVAACVMTSWLGGPAASASGPAALAGSTKFSGAAATYRDVVVPKATSIETPFNGSASVAVAGGGRLAGIVIRGTGKNTEGINIWAGRVLGDVKTPSSAIVLGDYRLGSGGTYHFVKTSADSTALPPGPYRIYLITDGAPLTVTLRLRGLSGSRYFKGGTSAHAVVGAPKDQPVSRPMGEANLVMASDTHTLKRRGLALQAVRLSTVAYAGGQYIYCHRNEPDSTPGDSYAPTCIRRDSTLANDRYPETEPANELFVNAWAGVPAGYQSLGFTYVTESVVTAMESVTLWLDY